MAETAMPDTIIENPILNSPFREPDRHWRFTDEGITNEIVATRRASAYFVPIPPPKKKGKQLQFDTEWTQDRIEPNDNVNRIRQRVKLWREREYGGVTQVSRKLLQHWRDPDRENKLFFCQIEALETLIFLTEAAEKVGDNWIKTWLGEVNAASNPGLNRIAMKMATGTGKTVVMAMLIAWHALNKIADPKDRRFSDTFLVVTPGITIRDRLRVLWPHDPENYYRLRDLVPPELIGQLGRAKILITNFHAFKIRKLIETNKLTKEILGTDFDESPAQMVNRVCRELGSKRNIVVINDEAHHCYRRKPDGEAETLKGEDRTEAEKRNEEARVWISGLEAVRDKIGIRGFYDLSATPFFLRGSGYREGDLFPWVVSDFSLIDAIESGIVKIPRVPVADDTMQGDQPTYRYLWPRIREELPRKGRRTEAVEGEPKLPVELQGALHSLYGNYEARYRQWEQSKAGGASNQTPPVFIVVCNNTNVSKLVFDYVGGWQRTLPDGSTIPVPGQLPLFSNVEDGRWKARPLTILIDSEQLESGDAMSPEFKQIAALEIDEFKSEYRARFPGRDAESLTDEDLLREVMNTVGKPGKLGEQIRCVVSVSMLTEGWDANTVTHVLGIRAFGTQLLCEQVVGRALRRQSYEMNEEGPDKGLFNVEYADVFGIPFDFTAKPVVAPPQPPRETVQVKAISPERDALEIRFPRVEGYRVELPEERLTAAFNEDSILVLSPDIVGPSITRNSGIIGEGVDMNLKHLGDMRPSSLVFNVTQRLLYTKWRDPGEEPKLHLFGQLKRITKQWLDTCLVCKGETYPGLLMYQELADMACNRITAAITRQFLGERPIKALIDPYNPTGSTRHVRFNTSRA